MELGIKSCSFHLHDGKAAPNNDLRGYNDALLGRWPLALSITAINESFTSLGKWAFAPHWSSISSTKAVLPVIRARLSSCACSSVIPTRLRLRPNMNDGGIGQGNDVALSWEQ